MSVACTVFASQQEGSGLSHFVSPGVSFTSDVTNCFGSVFAQVPHNAVPEDSHISTFNCSGGGVSLVCPKFAYNPDYEEGVANNFIYCRCDLPNDF